ncbi:HAD-IA family hydrolase [Dermatophilaceae bacterium Sec6.4]
MSVRAVLWDADGVLQYTPDCSWDLAVQVVAQFPDTLIGAAIDEDRIRATVHQLGLGDHVEDILSVWSTFDLLAPSLEVVSLVRAAGTACYLATNQDSYRAAGMRQNTAYDQILDGLYFSCDIGIAKPSRAFFKHVVTDLGLVPDQLLFLDDQSKNIAGARSAGLNAEQWAHDDGVARLTDILHAHGVRVDQARDESCQDPSDAANDQEHRCRLIGCLGEVGSCGRFGTSGRSFQ